LALDTMEGKRESWAKKKVTAAVKRFGQSRQICKPSNGGGKGRSVNGFTAGGQLTREGNSHQREHRQKGVGGVDGCSKTTEVKLLDGVCQSAFHKRKGDAGRMKPGNKMVAQLRPFPYQPTEK